MQRYLLRRLVLAIPTVIGLTIVVFTVLRVAPRADAVKVLMGTHNADPAYEAQLRERLGLTGSIPAQYLHWAGGLLRASFGTSIKTNRPVSDELPGRFAVSLELGVLGLLLALVIAVPLGLISAVQQDRWPDYLLRSLAIALNAIPGFWAAILVITLGGVWFHWAPPIHFAHLTTDPVANLKIIALPALLIALGPLGAFVRLVRATMLEVLRQDYTRTARAKGLSTRQVYVTHALRNALLPVVTMVGLQLPALVAGTVIFERIFGLPGIGNYLLQAIADLDYPVVQMTNLVFGLAIIGSTLLVDLSYAILDPRIRYS